MPLSDAGACLPIFVLNLVRDAALDVPQQALLLTGVQFLSHHHGTLFAVLVQVVVVDAGQDVQTCLFVASVEGQHGVVEVNHVGVEEVHHLQHAVAELGLVGVVGCRGATSPVPLAADAAAGAVSHAGRVALLVEVLRVVAFPPQALAVVGGEQSVVVLRHLIPRPRVRGVNRDAQGQSILLAGLAPGFQDVLLGAHVHRVPWLVGALPEVEVVVMLTEGHEIAGTHVLVELHQGVGVELVGFPFVNHILETELRGVAILRHVVDVLLTACEIHLAGIPVAVFRLALRTPVGPDSELGVFEPFGAFPLAGALPGGFVASGLQGQVVLGAGVGGEGTCQNCQTLS